MNLLQRARLERIESELLKLIAQIQPTTRTRLDLSAIRRNLNKVIDEEYKQMLVEKESIYYRLSISQRPALMKNIFINSAWVQFNTLVDSRKSDSSKFWLENSKLENLLALAETNSSYSRGQIIAHLINWYHFDNLQEDDNATPC